MKSGKHVFVIWSSMFVYIVMFEPWCCQIFKWFDSKKSHTLVIGLTPYLLCPYI